MITTTTQVNYIKGVIKVEGLYQGCLYGNLVGHKNMSISTSPVQQFLVEDGLVYAKTYTGSIYNLKGDNNLIMKIIQSFMQ